MASLEKLRLGRPRGLPSRKREEAHVDLADIQGNVLRGYTYPTAAYIFLRIDDVEKGKALLARMLDRITTGEPWQDGGPATAIQLAFTYAGLERLGVPADVLATFPEEFREGMAARAEILGDRGPAAPEHWEPGLGTGEAHVLVTVWAIDAAHLDEVRDELRVVGATAGATTVINETRAEALENGRDHFGFYDGIGQPSVKGTGVEGRPGDGIRTPDGWRDVETGEFLLGYGDEDASPQILPAAPFDRNGTFVVYRKLAMDVPAFRQFLETAGREYPGGPEKLAAKIVGRWRDGTPLALSPDEPDPEIVADPQRINNFGYGDDPLGLKCPLGSHIRRTNPRDERRFFDTRLSRRHRIIRRGRTYGPPLDEGATEDDGRDRGLVFVCFATDLWRQFETIQTQWCDDGEPFGLGADKDPLIGCPGEGRHKFTIGGDPPHIVSPLPRFVTMRGGEYLFQPSVGALRRLAEDSTWR